MMDLFLFVWAGCVIAAVAWALCSWLFGVVNWYLHGKSCYYCRQYGRQSPFRVHLTLAERLSGKHA